MQGGLSDIGVVEGTKLCRGHRLGIAVHIGEAAATIESPSSNALHTLGYVDGGEAGASRESTFSNTRHAIRHAVVGDDGGDGDVAGVLGTACHLGLSCLSIKVIPDAVDLDCLKAKMRVNML